MNERASVATKQAVNETVSEMNDLYRRPFGTSNGEWVWGRDHAVCGECYAGLVDIGHAPIIPVARAVSAPFCCCCGRAGDTGVFTLNVLRQFDSGACGWSNGLSARRIEAITDGSRAEEASK